MWKAGYFLFLLFSLGTSTSAVSAGNVTAYMAHNVTPHSNGINVDYTLKRKDAANNEWYKKATVHYPKDKANARTMNARGRVTPLGAGIALAVTAAGYAIDSLSNQIIRPGPPPEGGTYGYEDGYFWTNSWISGAHAYATAEDACLATTTYESRGYRIEFHDGRCWAYNGSQWVNHTTMTKRSCIHTWSTSASWCATGIPPTTDQPLTTNELFELISNVLNTLPPEVLRDIFEKAGYPIITPELAAAMQAYADESDSLADNEAVNDESIQDEENPETDEEPLPEDQADLQQITVQKVDWDAGLGSGSCPQSKSVSGMFPIDSEWGTVCDAAQNIFKPIFLLICALGSAAIIAGQRLWG